jgi:hypothetical protein
MTRLTGTVTPAEENIVVQYTSPARSAAVQTATGADGSYVLDVPITANEQGLLVARDANDQPRLALQRVNLVPDTPQAGLALTLVDPLPPPAPFRLLGGGDAFPDLVEALPPPPGGLSYESAQLAVVETSGGQTWRATLVAARSLRTPRYDLPGFQLVTSYRALSDDGLRGSYVDEGATSFLAPPDAGALPAPSPGGTWSWAAVPGATLYTLRLYAPNVPDPPLWEAACTATRLTIPQAVPAVGPGAQLLLEAWDAPGITPYALADTRPRQLRIPAQPLAPGGRRSWHRWKFS